MAAISLRWNFLVSRNCASSGAIPSFVYVPPSSRIGTPCAFLSPVKFSRNCVFSRLNVSSDIFPGMVMKPPRLVPFPKNSDPNFSAAPARPMAALA